jgi:prepilin-type N-terminal cleavage/methylation domain-containing protein
MKKGFTLLEIIVAIGMSSIIITILTSMILNYNLKFKKETLDMQNYFYIHEAFLFIEQEFNKSKNIKTYDNKIELNYIDEFNKKIIQFNGKNKIEIIDVYKNNIKAVNIITSNIKSLSITQKENIIYIIMIDVNGVKYEKCFGIKK